MNLKPSLYNCKEIGIEILSTYILTLNPSDTPFEYVWRKQKTSFDKFLSLVKKTVSQDFWQNLCINQLLPVALEVTQDDYLFLRIFMESFEEKYNAPV